MKTVFFNFSCRLDSEEISEKRWAIPIVSATE